MSPLQVILCSACSGHGFKLSPAVGYVLADMVRHGECREFHDELKIHKLDRHREGHAEALDSFATPAL
jgi:glycine/D-amino acid oxidase-like deaminating enzyme